MITGHRSLAEIEAKLDGSEVRYWAAGILAPRESAASRALTYESWGRIPFWVELR